VHYFSGTVIGGEIQIHDPDELIHDIAWQSADDLVKMELSYPDDRKMLLDLLAAGVKKISEGCCFVMLIKPEKLKRGDKIATVSPSSGLAGEETIRARYEQGVRRLEE